MAGVMYLGNQMVSPVIIQSSSGGGFIGVPTYSVVDGVITRTNYELQGNEFDGIETMPADNINKFFSFSRSNISGRVVFNDLTTLTDLSALRSCFLNTKISSISFPKLETVTSGSLYNMANGCSMLTSADLSAVTRIEDDGMDSCFYNSGLESFDLSALESVETNGMSNAFCSTNIQTATFPSLEAIGDEGMVSCFSDTPLQTITFTSLWDLRSIAPFEYTFNNCPNLQDVYFPALKTASFESGGDYDWYNFYEMFDYYTGSESGSVTVHFPSNLESVVQNLYNYPSFDGDLSIVHVAFDLPATE